MAKVYCVPILVYKELLHPSGCPPELRLGVLYILRDMFQRAVPVMFAVVVVLSGCGGDKEQAAAGEDDRYAGWQTYTYRNIRIVYPPGHPQVDNLYDMAQGYVAALKRNCRFLRIPVPEDTLVVYYYTGFGQGQSMTGRQYPFVRDGRIHFWLPSFYGPTLMHYLLPLWLDKEPQYSFLKHGIISLFDYSGQNYHEMTHLKLQKGTFVPLMELAVDTTVDSNTERDLSAEAASFVDFLVFTYGIEGLRLLYRAEAPFEMASEGIIGIKPDSLQVLWLDFVDRTMRNDFPGLPTDSGATGETNPKQ